MFDLEIAEQNDLVFFFLQCFYKNGRNDIFKSIVIITFLDTRILIETHWSRKDFQFYVDPFQLLNLISLNTGRLTENI